MQVNIHYTRLSASGTISFREELLAAGGQRLTTYVMLTEQERLQMSQACWKNKMLPQGYLLGSLRKHYYYGEYFTVLECFNLEGGLAGYYSDIATPLQKVGDDYYLTDLFLDYWLAPGQPPLALDEDEFEAAIAQGVMTVQQISQARSTFSRLSEEIAAGIFPGRYIGM
jgi:predicted RNA-binding protein associated with RNAse of E/G family